MRKNKLYRLTNILIVVLYLTIIFIQQQFNLVLFNAQINWFMLLCFFVGVSMFIKAFIFTSDSSLWLAVVLVLVSIILFLFNYYSLKFSQFWPVILSVISLASIITGLVFKEIYQVKIFSTLTLLSVPCYLFSLNILQSWMFVLLLIGALALSFIIIVLLPQRWYPKKYKN